MKYQLTHNIIKDKKFPKTMQIAKHHRLGFNILKGEKDYWLNNSYTERNGEWLEVREMFSEDLLAVYKVIK